MKVILTSRVKNLGNIGDVVSVKDGYAKNFLIPKGYAMNYTTANYKIFEERKQKITEENLRLKELAVEIKNKLAKKKLILIESCGDDGKLYGSVNTVKLAKKINELANLKEGTVEKSNIIIDESIKNIGVYQVNLEPHPEVSFKLDVVVARSIDEAANLQKTSKEKKKESNKEEE